MRAALVQASALAMARAKKMMNFSWHRLALLVLVVGGPLGARTSTASTPPTATATALSRLTPPVFLAATGWNATEAADDHGLILRRDVGRRWRRVWSNPDKVLLDTFSALAISHDGAVLYVGTFDGHVAKSGDGGRHWRSTGVATVGLRTLAVDPLNSSIVYAGTGGGLYKTINGGRSWHVLTHGLPKVLLVRSLAFDPQHPTHLWVGGESYYDPRDPALYHSDDGGTTWTAVPFFGVGAGTGAVTAIALSPITRGVMYVGTDDGRPGGLYKSSDGGRTWHLLLRMGLLANGADLSSLVLSESIPGLLYVGVQTYGDEPLDHTTTQEASLIYRSIDGGTTWTAGRGLPASGDVHPLLTDPTQPFVAYAGLDVGLYRTSDAGASWQRWTEGDLNAHTNIVGLVDVGAQSAVPAAPATALVLPPATSTSLPSTPTALPTSTPRAVAVKTTWLRVNPQHPRTLYVGGSFDCPDMTQQLDVCSDWALRSTDGGQSWTDLRGPLKAVLRTRNGSAVTTILPALLGADGQHIYVRLSTHYVGRAPCGEGVPSSMSSADGGVHWKNDAVPPRAQSSCFDLYPSPLAPSRLYSVTPNAGRPGQYLSSSSDAGRTWRDMTNPLDQLGMCCQNLDLVPGPLRAQTVYVNVRPYGTPPAPAIAVERSDDGGLTWAQVMTPTAVAASRSLTVSTDPHAPGMIVGTADDGRAPSLRRYLSADGGRTWRAGLCPGGLLGVGCPSLTLNNVFGAGAAYAVFKQGIYRFQGSGLAEARLPISTNLPVSTADVLDMQAGTRAGDPIYLLGKGVDGLHDGLLYRSLDAGNSWHRLLGSVSLTPYTLLPTPADPAARACCGAH